MPYKTEDLERQFKNLGNSRRGRSKYVNDASYWTGGRCNWGGNHSLKEDCQTLAGEFTKIESLSAIKKELEDPNITKQREGELRSKLAFLATQLDEIKKTNKKYRDEVNKNNKRKEDNSKIINNTVSNPDNKHWIWNFLTLENIVIMGACYALYQILKEEKR